MSNDLSSRRAFLLASLPWTEKQLDLGPEFTETLRVLAEHAAEISAVYDQPEEGAEGATLLSGRLVVEGVVIDFDASFDRAFQCDDSRFIEALTKLVTRLARG
jgi:hypothetical protein